MNKIIVFLVIVSVFYCEAQQTDKINFTTANARLTVDAEKQTVSGLIAYKFEVLQDLHTFYIDAKDMEFNVVFMGSKMAETTYDGERLYVKDSLSKGTKSEIIIGFSAKPKKAMYFVGWENDAPNQVWTQGQGKYTSNWLPSFDDENEKVDFDILVTFDSEYQVIGNGKMVRKDEMGDLNATLYEMEEPMSSYLLAMIIGKYLKKVEQSESGVPLEMYYYPKDSNKVEPTYRYTKKIFDYLEKEIDYAYPWENYKQVPVHDFLYGGMENTTTTVFADTYVVDSIGFNDRNYVNVNAHELAHQWFGDLVTAKSGEHHWLQEGFATYYALLAERHLFGENYYYWRLYEYAQELKDQDRAGNGTSLLNPKSSSLTFYKRGAWVLHALREKVGDSAYKAATRKYLEDFEFKNAETSDFISKIQESSGQDLSSFFETWIKNDEFPYDKAFESLMQSKFIQEYEMVDCEAANSKCGYYLDSYLSDEAKIKIIQQKPDLISSKTFKNSIPVRRAIAEVLTTVPKELKTEYETLLDDNSYLTKEAALYNLWTSFSEERSDYLDKMANVEGLNYNIRLLWLALALNTSNYRQAEKEQFYNELVDFTGPMYNFEVRMNAFQFLISQNGCNEECIENLNDASNHHNWRLSKFAKQQLDKIK